MAYTDRTVRRDFEELGPDIWVAIHNPMLMPSTRLQPKTHIDTDAEGKPVNPDQALAAMYEIAAGLVCGWNVYDPFDMAESPTPLELPATPEKVQLLPMTITLWITDIVGKAMSRQN
jgi:hypothetical protein